MVAFQCGYGHDGGKFEGLRKRINEREQFWLRQTVDFVQCQNRFPTKPLCFLEQQIVCLGMHLAGIGHQQQHVDSFQRRGHFLHHLPAQRGIRLVQTRRVNEDDLPLRLGHNSLNPVAGGLRLGGDDRDFLPYQTIHEGRLPRVRPSDDGHKPGAKRSLLLVAFFFGHHPLTLRHLHTLSRSPAHSY